MYHGIFVCGNFTVNRQRKVWQQCEWQSMIPVEPAAMRCYLPGSHPDGRGFGRSLYQSRATSSVRLHCPGHCPAGCLKAPRAEVAQAPFKDNRAWPCSDTEQLSCRSWVYSSDTIGVGISRVPELDFPLARVTSLPQTFSLVSGSWD